jgi:PAS domain S-box-containing protein
MIVAANAALTGSYDYGEVARSIFIAIAASYAALDLAGRVTATSGWVRAAWLTSGSFALGIGIWAMQFQGLLAFHLPVFVEYHWPTVLASIFLGILASAVALYVASRRKMGPGEALTGGVIMGSGIAGMHYLGIAAMRLPAITRFSPVLMVVSVLLAIFFSLVVLLMAFDLREETRWAVWRRAGSATVMGITVSAMQYTGMAAASFVPASPPDLTHAVRISLLFNNGIALVTLIVLVAAIVTSSVDRRASTAIRRLNEDLERRVAERTRELTIANEQLAEKEGRFRTLFEKNLAGVAIANQGQIVDCNEAWARILGYENPNEVRGRPTTDLYFNLADRKPVLDSLERGEALLSREMQLKRKDGTPVWVLFNSLSFSGKDGSPIVQATIIDITERKRAETRLREYEKVVECLEEIIVVVDREYRYVLANRAFLSRRGLEIEQVVGHLMPEIVNQGLFETVVKQKLDECFQGKVVTYELKYTYPKLGERDLLISYFPIDGPNGIDRAACVLQDITERKRAEQALQGAQAELARVTRALTIGELVASIAHEVNQPLTGIVTNGNFALRELAGGKTNLERLQGAIAEIVEDGTRASAVISRIRDLLKKDTPDRAELDVNDVIREVTILVRDEAARNRVQFRLDLAAGLPNVLGDRVQLQQVLINLIMNGVDAMRTVTDRPWKLEIKSAKHADGVLVRVQDSGIGLDPDRLERIFEPFFTTKPQGIGMGLSISRSIIESHGGRLWTETGAVGAIFQFILPGNKQ